MEHSFPQIQVKNNKKKVFTKNGTLFPPNSRGHLRSDAHQSKIIAGDADVDHTQTIRGGYSQIIGEDISPHPPGFRHPWLSTPTKSACKRKTFSKKVELIAFLKLGQWLL